MKISRVLIVVFLIALMLPEAVSAKNSNQFNNKYTFDPVTFSDGTVGVIEAGSKQVDHSTFTSCSYYSEGHVDYLGMYQSGSFASSDPAAVEQFCLDNYINRQ